jgi:isocitrate/isopropylmalate dehydrogenase
MYVLLYVPSLIDNSIKRERIEGTDLVFLRELTGGIYFGEKEDLTEAKPLLILVLIQSRSTTFSKKGFELAMTRTKKLCCVDKANVWKPPVYGEKQYKPWKRLSRSHCKLRICRCGICVWYNGLIPMMY